MSTCPNSPEFEGMEFSLKCTEPYSDSVEKAILGVTLVIIFIVIALLSYGLVALQKDSETVFFQGSIQFMVVMSLGSIILLCSVLVWPLNDTTITCLIKPAFITVGVALMFGILCATIYKIWFSIIYRSNLVMLHEILDMDRSRLTRFDMLIVLSLVFVIESILLIVLYAVDDFRPKCECQAFNSSDTESLRFSNCTLSPKFIVIIFVVNLFPVLVAFYLGTRTMLEFNKNGRVLGVSKEQIDGFFQVSKSVGVLFILFIVGIAVTYTSNSLQSSPKTRVNYYVFRSLFMMLTAFLPVLVLYCTRCSRLTARKHEELERNLPLPLPLPTTLHGNQSSSVSVGDVDVDVDAKHVETVLQLQRT